MDIDRQSKSPWDFSEGLGWIDDWVSSQLLDIAPCKKRSQSEDDNQQHKDGNGQHVDHDG